MRRIALLLSVALLVIPVAAQRPPRRGPRIFPGAEAAEGAVKQAMDQFVEVKKLCERDSAILEHLRAADAALTDPMQPSNALQKAFEEISDAERLAHTLTPEFLIIQGLMRARQAVSDARRSPESTDFGRLRSIVRGEATGPVTRTLIRRASALETETLAWLKVQQLIAEHLKGISEVTGDTLQTVE